MAKNKQSRTRKTRQGFCGMTIPQGIRLDACTPSAYGNIVHTVAEFSNGFGQVTMPLNRAMRRLAKRRNIPIEEVE